MKHLMTGFLLLMLVTACGDATDENDAKVEAPKAKAHNPLASQQQLLRDARDIQSILDEDAKKKKAALDAAN